MGDVHPSHVPETAMTKGKHRKRRARERAAKTGESYATALRHVSRHKEALVASNDSTTDTRDAVEETTLIHCSFCGKSRHEVKKLIAGPQVYICDECVDLSSDILDREAPDRVRADTTQIFEMSDRIMKLRHASDEQLPSLVNECREAGATWSQIGRALDLDAETAERRFGSTRAP